MASGPGGMGGSENQWLEQVKGRSNDMERRFGDLTETTGEDSMLFGADTRQLSNKEIFMQQQFDEEGNAVGQSLFDLERSRKEAGGKNKYGFDFTTQDIDPRRTDEAVEDISNRFANKEEFSELSFDPPPAAPKEGFFSKLKKGVTAAARTVAGVVSTGALGIVTRTSMGIGSLFGPPTQAAETGGSGQDNIQSKLIKMRRSKMQGGTADGEPLGGMETFTSKFIKDHKLSPEWARKIERLTTFTASKDGSKLTQKFEGGVSSAFDTVFSPEEYAAYKAMLGGDMMVAFGDEAKAFRQDLKDAYSVPEKKAGSLNAADPDDPDAIDTAAPDLGDGGATATGGDSELISGGFADPDAATASKDTVFDVGADRTFTAGELDDALEAAGGNVFDAAANLAESIESDVGDLSKVEMQLEPMMRARAAKLQAAGPQTANAVENMQNRLADAGADAGAAAGAPIVDNSVTTVSYTHLTLPTNREV